MALGRATVLDRVVEAATFCTVDCTDVVAPFSAVLRSLLSLLSGLVLPRLASGSASSTATAAAKLATIDAARRLRAFDHPVIRPPLMWLSYPGRADRTTDVGPG